MLDTSARLLRLLGLLQVRPAWTAAQLAERLEVTTRTVRRDVVKLRDLGYPIEAEPGPAGGYRLTRGAELPPLLFDEDEAVAVAIGLRGAADGSVAGLDDAALSALAKLHQVLPGPLAARVQGLHEVVTDLHGRDPDPVAGPVFRALAQACRQGVRVRLAYVDREGRATDRRMDPHRLVRSGPRWYLVAHDLDRRAWRTLRVDRIAEVHLTVQPVDLADPPDAAALVGQAQGVGPYAVRARFRLGLGLADAVAVVPRTVGTHEPEGPEATVVTAGGPDVVQLARWLCTLGEPVEVLDPPELRAELHRLAADLAARNAPT